MAALPVAIVAVTAATAVARAARQVVNAVAAGASAQPRLLLAGLRCKEAVENG